MSRTDQTRTESATGDDAGTGEANSPFFQELEELLPEPLTGREAMEAVVCILSLRLSAGGLRNITKPLPGQVRALVAGCPHHHKEQPELLMDREGFMHRVAAHLRPSKPNSDRKDAEQVTRAVLAVMRRWTPEADVRQVARMLPFDLREIWLASDAPTRPENSIVQAVLVDVRQNVALPDGRTEQEVVSAVLCTMFQRLTRGEDCEVIDHLPGLMQEWVKPCVLHRREAAGVFDRDEFARRVASHLNTPPEQADELAIAVFAAVQKVISVREIREVVSQLPRSLQELWVSGLALAGMTEAARLRAQSS